MNRFVLLSVVVSMITAGLAFAEKPAVVADAAKKQSTQPTGGSMKLKLHEIELYSKNLDESKKFYGEVLGLPIKLDQNGLKIFDTGASRSLDFNCSQHFENKKNAFSFLVRDVDEYRKTLVAKGLKVPDVKDAHLGMRTLRFEDPDGNIIIINSPTEKSPGWLKDEMN